MPQSTHSKQNERCGHCKRPVSSLKISFNCHTCKKYFHTECIGESVPEIATMGEKINTIIQFAKKTRILFFQCKNCQIYKRPIIQQDVPIPQPQLPTKDIETALSKKYKSLCGTLTELQLLQEENKNIRLKFVEEIAARDTKLAEIEERLQRQNSKYDLLNSRQITITAENENLKSELAELAEHNRQCQDFLELLHATEDDMLTQIANLKTKIRRPVTTENASTETYITTRDTHTQVVQHDLLVHNNALTRSRVETTDLPSVGSIAAAPQSTPIQQPATGSISSPTFNDIDPTIQSNLRNIYEVVLKIYGCDYASNINGNRIEGNEVLRDSTYSRLADTTPPSMISAQEIDEQSPSLLSLAITPAKTQYPVHESPISVGPANNDIIYAASISSLNESLPISDDNSKSTEANMAESIPEKPGTVFFEDIVVSEGGGQTKQCSKKEDDDASQDPHTFRDRIKRLMNDSIRIRNKQARGTAAMNQLMSETQNEISQEHELPDECDAQAASERTMGIFKGSSCSLVMCKNVEEDDIASFVTCNTDEFDNTPRRIADWNEPDIYDRELTFRIYFVPVAFATAEQVAATLMKQFPFILMNSIQIKNITCPRSAVNLYRHITVELLYRSDYKKTIRYVKFGSISCKARDIYEVIQCYRCLRFGHMANTCNEEIICGRCSGNHQTKNCGENFRKCVNCIRFNTNSTGNDANSLLTDHCAIFQSCPIRVAFAKKDTASSTENYSVKTPSRFATKWSTASIGRN